MVAEKTDLFSDEHIYTKKELIGQSLGMANGFVSEARMHVEIETYPLSGCCVQLVIRELDNANRQTGFGYTTQLYGISGRQVVRNKIKESLSNRVELQPILQKLVGIKPETLLP